MNKLTNVGALIVLAMTCQVTVAQTDGTKPNVVLIYGDDVGYGDVGVYGSEKILTPNIDRLAKDGLVFSDGHSTAPTCSPSRYAMLTGCYGFRQGLGILSFNAPLSIAVDRFTLPRVFKQAGYATAIIGKWHLGLGNADPSSDRPRSTADWNGEVKPGPLEVGFDYSFLLPNTNDRVPCVYLRNHRVVNLDPKDPLWVQGFPAPRDPRSTTYPDGRKNPEAMTYYRNSRGHNHSVINGIGRGGSMAGGKSALWDDETMADTFLEEAQEYIAANKDKPFFLFFSSQDIHCPRAPHKRFQGKTDLGYRGDAMVALDWVAGQLMDTLEEHGLAENTIVIFSSDNGPVYDDGYNDGTTVRPTSGEVDGGHDASGPYRGGKYQLYEGGTRVPFIIRWPGKIQPGTSEALVSQVDFLASFAALLNVDVPKDQATDSRNMMSAFLGKDRQGRPHLIEEGYWKLALRKGAWKYIALDEKHKKKAELYNLDEDISEQDDLLDRHPEVAAEMARLLQSLVEGGTLERK